MIYGKTPFAELPFPQKIRAIIDPQYTIKYPETVNVDAVDAIKQCLQRSPSDRPPIRGHGGLLDDHPFLLGNRLEAANP
jgi:hypothetical protein